MTISLPLFTVFSTTGKLEPSFAEDSVLAVAATAPPPTTTSTPAAVGVASGLASAFFFLH